MASSPTAPLDERRIVVAAGELVDERGPDDLTLTGVADRLGVTQPALYRHVNGLSDLWRVLGVSTREMLAERLAEAGVGRTGEDAVRSIAEAWRQFGRDHPGRYRCTDRHAVSGDDGLEQAANRTIDVIERSLGGFGLSRPATTGAAHTLRCALHGFVAYEIVDGNPDRTVADQSFDHLIEHLCSAFAVAAEREGAAPNDASESF